MLTIRLRRIGAKQEPAYRLVVSDSRSVPTGPFVDTLGSYDPRRAGAVLQVDVARAEEWIRKGAQPSASVRGLLARAKRAQA